MGHSEDKRQLWRDAVLIVIACIMYSVSADIITPIHVIPGSVLGIAQLFYAVKGWPVGVVNLVINIPIMVICVSRFGRKVLIYTVAVVCGNSLFMDVLMPFMPEVNGFLWKIGLCIIAGAANGIACCSIPSSSHCRHRQLLILAIPSAGKMWTRLTDAGQMTVKPDTCGRIITGCNGPSLVSDEDRGVRWQIIFIK